MNRYLIYVIILFCLMSLAITPTQADEGSDSDATQDIRLDLNEAQTDYPANITFQIYVGSSAKITSIELEYGTIQRACGVASAKIKPEFTPSRLVKTEWEWDLTESNTLPPGTQIWWRWHIKDEAGNDLSTEETTISFKDERYQWNEIESEELLLYSAVDDNVVNQGLWQAGLDALNRLETEVGARPSQQVQIYNYPDTDALRNSVNHAREWMGGLALPDYDTVLLGVNQANLAWGESTMAHELGHIILHQITFNCVGSALPRWLDEGFATYSEGVLDDKQQLLLDTARDQDKLHSLQTLSSSFPNNSIQASLAYAQSGQVVTYLIETYGQEKINALFQTIQTGQPHNQALQTVYGFDTQDLDNEWRITLGLEPRDRVATVAPLTLPTIVPYGAQTPTAIAQTEGEPTSLPPTATSTEISPSPTVTTEPTNTPQPVRSLPTESKTYINPFIMALGIGVGLIIVLVMVIAIGLWKLR